MRAAGVVTATLDQAGNLRSQATGCAVFAADGRTCERPLTPDSLIRVASISKLVAAIGVMRLVEQGKLDLDRDVGTYLKFPVRNAAFPSTAITLRQLLSHTSSLRDGETYALPLGETLQHALAAPDRWDLTRAPGTHFTYSNFNAVVIGTVMEAVTNERFDRLMQRLVFDPLGIDGCFNWAMCSDTAIVRAAALYRTGPDETEWHPDGPWIAQVDDLKGRKPDCPVRRADPAAPCDLAAYRPGTNGALFSPQGGLRISIRDLAKIAGVFMSERALAGTPLLKPETVRAMLTPQWLYKPATPNGETEKASMCAYGLSIQLTDLVEDSSCRDNVFADGIPRAGHLGEAYGLFGGLWIDTSGNRAALYLITGTSADPRTSPATNSALTRIEEETAASLR